jgi:hypothetical protein
MMAIKWAPDFSTFSTDPNAVWRDDGFYRSVGGDPWEASSQGTWERISPLNPTGNDYAQLKQAGAWNLQDPNLQNYLAKSAYTEFGGNASSDWRTNPHAASMLLGKLGLSTYQPTNLFGGPSRSEQIQQAFGFSPEYIAQIEASRKLQQHESNKSNRGGLSGVLDAGGDFVEAAAPLALAAAGAYYGVNALGGLGGAGAASAGGTAAGTAGEMAALGSGLTPGAAGAAGITPGAAGAAGLAATAPAGTALAPGYFAAETLAPAIGAGSFGATSGASGGGSALAPSGTGLPSGGVLSTIASGLPGVLGAIASDKQADAYSDLARDYMAVGAPARARFEASYAPGFSMEDDPGYKEALEQAAKATMHGLSVGGNPAGSPNAWAQSLRDLYQQQTYKALQDYRNQNASAGGMGALTQAAPGAANSAIASQGNVFNALGAAANDIFNPPKTLTQILREIRAAGM